MKLFIGIDPGLYGAVACMDQEGKILDLRDTPILDIGKKGVKNDYQISVMRDILLKSCYGVREPSSQLIVCLESVHAMPGQGVTSMFTMGRGLGIWEGILSGLKIPYDKVTPQRWKKAMLDGMPKDKDSSRLRAQQLFPDASLARKKDHGRAEALLMAEFMRRNSAGPDLF